ncbi:hypothetical protein VTO42DRAFT_8987 [Malbranchea cinnamomea]
MELALDLKTRRKPWIWRTGIPWKFTRNRLVANVVCSLMTIFFIFFFCLIAGPMGRTAFSSAHVHLGGYLVLCFPKIPSSDSLNFLHTPRLQIPPSFPLPVSIFSDLTAPYVDEQLTLPKIRYEMIGYERGFPTIRLHATR